MIQGQAILNGSRKETWFSGNDLNKEIMAGPLFMNI